jgi:hypothetical protein
MGDEHNNILLNSKRVLLCPHSTMNNFLKGEKMVGIKRNHKKKVEIKHTPYSEFEKAMKVLETFDKGKVPTESEAVGLLAAFEIGTAVRMELLEEARKYPPDSVSAFALVNASQNLSIFLNNFFEQFNKEEHKPAK